MVCSGGGGTTVILRATSLRKPIYKVTLNEETRKVSGEGDS